MQWFVCLECKGHGHIRSVCPNAKKRGGRSSRSSEESESDDNEKQMKNLVAFGAHKAE